MSSVILPPPAPPAPVGFPAPSPKRWTCDEFHRLGDAGVLEGQNLILIDGEILQMPAAGGSHDVALSLLDDLIRKCFPTGFTVRCQMSLVLGQSIDPVPDLAVVRGGARDFLRQKPTTAELVVEVSDSSLDYDVGDKASLYASAGIADYWVVDLVHRRLVVMRDSAMDASRVFGFAYATVTTFVIGQSASPLAAPAATVAVADLIP
jgi:Uma2 family endonuclease